MNLSKEAIEAIEKESATHYPTADNTNQLANMHTLGYCRGAKEALTNPEIYSKAGLIKKDEGLFTKKQMCDAFIDGNTDAHRPVERMFVTSNDWFEKKYPNYQQPKEAGLISLYEMILFLKWACEKQWMLWANGNWTNRAYFGETTTAQLFQIYKQQKQ
jgi:hypothetical protein